MQKTLQKPRVVILGAGFGGLTAARKMAGFADVTVVDRHNFQTFLPLLYQVSTAGLAADHVAHPVRGALRKTGVQFRMGTPISVDHKNKSVKLDSSEVLDFDYLIVALGSASADFGVPGVTEHALGMKSVHEALTIRAEVLRRFEDLCRFEDETIFSISVVGGGPTGVEMAGAFAELVRGPLKNDQQHAAAHIKINLIEAGSRILPMFSEKLSERGKKDLEKLGVTVHLNTAVKEIKPRMIETRGVILGAGFGGLTAARKMAGFADVTVVDRHNFQTFLPLLYQVSTAGLAAEHVAQQIKRIATGQDLKPFKYLDKGSMATIGRHKAIVEVKSLRMTGIPAWYAWLWLHLFYLLGGRNKIGTMADWTYNYLTFDRGNRHIMDSQ